MTITCVTYENLSKCGGAFYAHFRLRHKAFIERQGYNVSEYKRMEYDQYDTPAAVYLVYMGPNGEAWGCSRLTPVERGSMLKDIWPQLVKNPENIFIPDNWEGTRFCVDKDLPNNLRKIVCQSLVLAYFEAGLQLGIKKIIGVMPPYIFRKVFSDCGCTYEFLGDKIKIPNGDTIAAGIMGVTEDALYFIRQKIGIQEPVLFLDKESADIYRKAA